MRQRSNQCSGSPEKAVILRYPKGSDPSAAPRGFFGVPQNDKWRRIAAIVVLAMLLIANRASAHARLDRAEPAVGSTVDASPVEVRIWFTDDAVLSGTDVDVLDASGNQIDKKDLHADPKDKSIVAVSLPANLPAGKYKVVWHALCPQGHTTKGEFSFEVK